MRRQLTGLSIMDAITHMEIALEENPQGRYFIKRSVGPDREEVYTPSAIEVATWGRDDLIAQDFRFEDHTPEPETEPASPAEPSGKYFTREQVIACVGAAVGQHYYKNPDSHKIAIDAANRLFS